MDEEKLELLLYPETTHECRGTPKPIPDWKELRGELKKLSVNLTLLWTEYREQYPDGYGHTQFCELYRRWAGKLNPPMRMVHKAGEKWFVDYAGDTVPITDPEIGVVSQAQIFVAVLGASNCTYAEAQNSQATPN